MTTHRPRTRIAVALTATGLLLAGCSSSSPTHDNTAAAQPGNTVGSSASAPTSAAAKATAASAQPAQAAVATACSLISQGEAGAALGADPGPGNKFNSHGSSQCQFGSYATQFLLVNVTPTRGRAGYDLMHNNPKLAQTGVNLTVVGDRAFEVTGPGTASIYFNKGDVLVLVSVVIHTAAAPPKDQALSLAMTAAGRV